MERRIVSLYALAAALLLFVCAIPAYSVPWLPFGPDGGSARRLAEDPRDPSHLYLGAANGMLYESRNFGKSWSRLASVGKRDDLVLDSIVVDASNPMHLIVGAYVVSEQNGGIFISNDGGKTWINQAEMRGQSIRSLSAAPSNPKIMIAGTLRGVFRTVDGGQRWGLISPEGSEELHNVESIAIDPVDPNIIYAGTWHLPWKTTDGGEHWENIKQGIIDDSDVFSIIVDPKKPQIIYASACSGIYKSLDSGLEFTKVQGIPSTARRTRVLLQDPNHLEIVFAGTTEGLFRSENSGKTWSRTTGPEIIVNDVVVNPADSSQVLLATDRGGVLVSDDGGDTFRASNAGFSTRQVTAMKRDSRTPAALYIGVINDKEWGGVFKSENGGLAWKQRSEGLQGRDVFALGQAPDGTIVAGTSHGLFLLDEANLTWSRATHSPSSTESESSTASSAAATAALRLRGPVPIGRNLFAERNLKKAASPAKKRAAVVSARRKPVSRGGTRAPALAGRTKAAMQKKSYVARGKSIASARKTQGRSQPAIASPAAVRVNKPALPVVPAPSPEANGAAMAGFDGRVSSIVTSGATLLASTSMGLLKSDDNGATWTDAKISGSESWNILVAAKSNLLASSLHQLQFSSDGGLTWVAIRAPEALTQITAVAVEPNGQMWVGGEQGVFLSADAGATWTTPKNLFVSSVTSLFYDEMTSRVFVTTAGTNSVVYTIQMPQKNVTYTYSGWNLRFARPVGDHIVAATLFDGIVVQPKVMDSPTTGASTSRGRR